MAKQKPESQNDDVTFLGEAVDPEIQKKVDAYMELDESELIGDTANPDLVDEAAEASLSSEDVSDAPPLLPTDKLPKEVANDKPRNKKVGTKIAVADASEAEELIPASAPILPGDDDVVPEVEEPQVVVETDEVDEADEADLAPSAPPLPGSESAVEQDAPEIIPVKKSIAISHVDTVETLAVADETADEEQDTETGMEEPSEPVTTTIFPDLEQPTKKRHGRIEPITLQAEPSADQLMDPAPDFGERTIGELQDAVIQPVDVEEYSDRATAAAIDDIVASDADELLGIEDAKRAVAAPVAPTEAAPKAAVHHPAKTKKKKAKKERRRLRTKTIISLVVVLLLFAVGAAMAYPTSRYALLNAAGVRVSASMQVLDAKTDQPLRNVQLSIADKTAVSDADGNVRLDELRLGKQTISLSKPAFAEHKKDVVLGWGSNPLETVGLEPVGLQYSLRITNFLSRQPLTGGEVVSGEASARINDNGEAVLTVPGAMADNITIRVSAAGYRDLDITTSGQLPDPRYEVEMVPSAPHIFFSKRSGSVDLYRTDVDGQNQEVLLAGTGLERDDSLGIAMHPSESLVAFSSSRENARAKDGSLLTTLQLMDLRTKAVTRLAQSERVQIIDWVGSRLVYVRVAQGAPEDSKTRHQLVSYDTATTQETELASTNYFNDILSVNGAIYYSPALFNVNGAVGLYKINADGSDKKTVYSKEVWNLFRVSYDKLSVSAGQDWFELTLKTDNMVKVAGAPSVLRSRVYIARPDGQASLWLDERDGKSVLLAYNHASGEDKNVLSFSGMKSPVRWLDNDHVIFRLANGQETADYVLHVSSGEARKITDVTNSYGIDRWYYF